VWRFYTARNPNWDILVHARANGTVRKESDALPVAVHAYPSRIGPRLEPSGRGAKLLERWGEPKASPAGTLGEDVIVEVVEEEYEPTYGLAARYRGNASTPVTVRGIVRGVDRTLRPTTDGQLRELRRSNLTVERLSENESGVTYRIRLRDAKTGAPIAMSAPENPRYRPILVDEPDATLTVGDRRVRTNLSGMTTVRINESGVYTVRYDAESWLIHDPAYTDAATTVRWHPLATVAGWLSFGVRVVLWFLPFAVALYAGRRLGGLLRYRGEL
jgi:hypothetical protein